jgi:hypothetical protein
MVHRAVLAERDIDPVRSHLRHARLTAPLRIGVVSALQDDIDERIGDCVDAGFGDQRQELRNIVVVHGVRGR